MPLYEKLGFVPEYRLERFRGHLAGTPKTTSPRPLPGDSIDSLLELARDVTGTDRSTLLRRLIAERSESLRIAKRDDRVVGFLMARPGAVAMHIGPCIAGPETGAALLEEAWRTYAGRAVVIDIPTDHVASQALAQTAGLSVQRHLMRMCRGEKLAEQHASLWASAGPEKG